MLFSGKKNVFMCFVAFQKIFSDVWLCSWKYHRKHILYLLLTFSHIFSVAKRIYNIIHSSKHKKKTQKKKSSNPDTSRDRDWCEGEIAIGAVGASREASIAIEASRDRRGAGDVGGQYRQARLWTISTLSSFFLPLSLSLALSLSLSYFPRPKIIWSENGNGNDFPLFWLSFSVNWKCFSVWPNLK